MRRLALNDTILGVNGAIGFLSGLFPGLVAGIVLVLLVTGVLLFWPRPQQRPVAKTAADALPDLAVTLSSALITTAVDRLARATQLPVGTIEAAEVYLRPGRQAELWLTVRVPLFGRIVSSALTQFEVGPPPAIQLFAVVAGRVPLPGLIVHGLERRINTLLQEALARYPVELVDAATSETDATIFFQVNPAALDSLLELLIGSR